MAWKRLSRNGRKVWEGEKRLDCRVTQAKYIWQCHKLLLCKPIKETKIKKKKENAMYGKRHGWKLSMLWDKIILGSNISLTNLKNNVSLEFHICAAINLDTIYSKYPLILNIYDFLSPRVMISEFIFLKFR